MRFACARRPLDDIALAGARSGHRLRLAWIGGQDHVVAAGWRIGLECGPPFIGEEQLEIGMRVGEAADEIVIVANERHLAIVEVRQRHGAKIELPVVRAFPGAAVDRIEGAVEMYTTNWPLLSRALDRYKAEGGLRDSHGPGNDQKEEGTRRFIRTASLICRGIPALENSDNPRARPSSPFAAQFFETISLKIRFNKSGYRHACQCHIGI